MEKLYTIKQVAEILHFHQVTVYKMVEAGKIKGVKISNCWRIKEEEIKKILGE